MSDNPIRAYRKSLLLTQQQLAIDAGISISTAIAWDKATALPLNALRYLRSKGGDGSPLEQQARRAANYVLQGKTLPMPATIAPTPQPAALTPLPAPATPFRELTIYEQNKKKAYERAFMIDDPEAQRRELDALDELYAI